MINKAHCDIHKKKGVTQALRDRLSNTCAPVYSFVIFRVNKERTSSAGFTVVEALVALGILVIGLSGGFAATSLSLRHATLSKEQITAFYLAQEAVEMVRYRRDTNSLVGNHWLAGFAEQTSDPCGNNKICRVDATNNQWSTCTNGWGDCPVLRKHNTNQWYTYATSNTSPTIFTRALQIRPRTIPSIPDGSVVDVEVRITWTRPNGGTGSYIVTTMLYDLR